MLPLVSAYSVRCQTQAYNTRCVLGSRVSHLCFWPIYESCSYLDLDVVTMVVTVAVILLGATERGAIEISSARYSSSVILRAGARCANVLEASRSMDSHRAGCRLKALRSCALHKTQNT